MTEVIKRTLGDGERRYSVVRRLSFSRSAIDAAKGGDFQAQILVDIQRMLAEVGRREPASNRIGSFPWPWLLREANRVLSRVKGQLDSWTGPGQRGDLIILLDDLSKELGTRHQPEIQFAVIDQERRFIYHDWGREMIGSLAEGHRGLDGKDFYEDVFSFASGATAWLDRVSNVPRVIGGAYVRANIAVFDTCVSSGWKITVELHQDNGEYS